MTLKVSDEHRTLAGLLSKLPTRIGGVHGQLTGMDGNQNSLESIARALTEAEDRGRKQGIIAAATESDRVVYSHTGPACGCASAILNLLDTGNA